MYRRDDDCSFCSPLNKRAKCLLLVYCLLLAVKEPSTQDNGGAKEFESRRVWTVFNPRGNIGIGCPDPPRGRAGFSSKSGVAGPNPPISDAVTVSGDCAMFRCPK